jgi:signal transduction histidine kinase
VSAPPPNRETTDEIVAEVRRQQQIHLVQRIPIMSNVSMINAGAVLVVFWNEVSNPMLLTWFAVVVTFSLFQLAGWRRLTSRPTPERVSGRTLSQARYWSAAVGLVWGMGVLAFYTPQSVELQFFLAVVIAGMSAGTVAFLSPLPRHNVWFLVALLAPFVVRYAMDFDKLHIAIATLSAVFAITLLMGSLKGYHTLVEMVRSHQGMEKARSDLEDAIESTNDAFAFFDENRKLMIANSRFRQWFASAKKIRGGNEDGVLRQLDSGRWVVSTMRPTSRGGWVSVHVDVSDLKAREIELTAAKIKAEEADRAKTQFLANMSHELRTPLNAIIGFSQMMRDQAFGALGDPRYRAYVEDIYASGQHLLLIINDILDLSKIEFSRYELEYEPLEIEEVVRSSLSVCRSRDPNEDERRIDVEISPAAQWLDADRRALKQILINLVGNALKFTPADKAIGVRAVRDADGGATLTVWDKGVGIAADKIAEVRKPFYQAENTFSKQYAGAGLGLAIVDTLARGHGGEMTIESVEGEGTTVSIRFPPERALDNPAKSA